MTGRNFLKIAITPPEIMGAPEIEAERIMRLLSLGEADLLHLRHPLASREEIAGILMQLPPDIRMHITLHDHLGLAEEGLCGGIHLNRRNPDIPEGCPRMIRISRSCHSIDEILDCNSMNAIPHCQGKGFDYVTLSPVFDSISKQGYKSNFNLDCLSNILPGLGLDVIALGGVTPDTFDSLKKAGFAGAAMLGSFSHYFH